MVKTGVAETFVLRDGHITITDLPQRPQAQVCDGGSGDSKAKHTSVKVKGFGTCQNGLKTVSQFKTAP